MLAQPDSEPTLWQTTSWSERNYRKHGVEAALDLDSFRDGRDTTLFYTALDADGRVVGGLRAMGPYFDADESHAIVEWEGQPVQDMVRKMITDRLPFGVVEMKSAWVSDDPERAGSLTNTFARTAFPTMSLLGAQFSWPRPRLTCSTVWSFVRWRRGEQGPGRRLPGVTVTAPS